MTSMGRRQMLAIPIVAPFAGALWGNEARSQTDSAREMIRERYFPNVVLRTQGNKQVRFYDDLIKGNMVTINFMYCQCQGICVPVTQNLVKVQKLLRDRVGRDIFMYSITLKPEQDGPAELKQYTQMCHVGPGWTFLTGKRDDIELLRRSLGFTDPDPDVDKDKSNHIGNVRYGNEPLMLWAACPGMAKPAWIAESILWADRRIGAQSKKPL